MKNQRIVEDWIIRAKSNLFRARSGQLSEEILFEDLCFDCQQAVEKSLKALLIAHDTQAPRTHIIGILLEHLEARGISIPASILMASELTEFAVQTRYPGIYEKVTEEEFHEAREMAEEVYAWVTHELSLI